ncbi:CaiB/BaiF CoA transferase family protein [Heliorestis convoluta]|uniref:CoA-transferase n=1 Tax=Heliorestis convoluta TaxID=356322 RepID=A0A5Q2MYF6_9FIRM|nr:CaiB/BaiF CoA-transferase family protein [Heliorestis convoluta]QGG46433.1 CoA-transferase [Heliorestis convoluta]
MLQGIKVLDLSRLYPGPMASWLLADMGAEVIKVEDPQQGDYFREMGPSFDGMSTYYRSINGNKKSVILDLKQDQDRETFYTLVRQSQVLLESFRPGVASRLKVGYEDLKPLQPSLVYCSLSAYGQESPLKNRPAHDLNVVALSGILHLMGLQDKPIPVPPIQLADVTSAYYAVIAILGGVLNQARTGQGSYVDVSMLDSLYNWLAIHIASEEKPLRREDMELSGNLVCYNIYETKEGRHIAFAPLEPKFWKNFCRAIHREDLLSQHMERAEPGNSTYETVKAIFRSKTLEEWRPLLEEYDACWEPVLTPEEALNTAHIQQRNLLLQRGKGFTELAFPLKASTLSSKPRREAPRAGQDQEEVVGGLIQLCLRSEVT